MCDCLPICCVSIVYILVYQVNKFEARLLFLYLPLKVSTQWSSEGGQGGGVSAPGCQNPAKECKKNCIEKNFLNSERIK